jgi:hypothetical protein
VAVDEPVSEAFPRVVSPSIGHMHILPDRTRDGPRVPAVGEMDALMPARNHSSEWPGSNSDRRMAAGPSGLGQALEIRRWSAGVQWPS